MAASRSTTDLILDQLSAVPNVRVWKMFGEYALASMSAGCGSVMPVSPW